MKFLMCCLLNILFLAFTQTAKASEQISGVLAREINRSTVSIVLDNNKRYSLSSSDSETISTLSKMSPGDLIIGTGTIDDANGILYLENMDYVGLQRILGLWHADNGFVEFRNFSDLNVYSKVIQSNVVVVGTNKKQFKYSLTPSTGNDWVLFLSDSDSTTMGTIQVDRSNATIKVFDSQSGAVKQVIRLSKVTN